MQVHDSLMNSSVDLIQVDLQIMGDPYFLSDTGVGNYVAASADTHITSDGTMDYLNGEINIHLTFRNPIDYNDKGLMDFIPPRQGDAEVIQGFSGHYRLISLKSSWSNNMFTQDLVLLRHRNQEQEADDNESGPQRITETKEKSSNADSAASTTEWIVG